MISFTDLALRRGPRLLFSGASLQIHPGFRVGVTGANGSGKSSLFAMLRGELHADTGEFHIPADWVIAHVAQETPADPRPALEYVLDGDAELREIEAAMAAAERADDGHALALAHARFDAINGYSLRARATAMLHGLGFVNGGELRPVAEYSGGWRMRLNLARALICRSDLLLLDEPTNHLDLDAVIWLEQWLTSYPGTLLLISHDRDFLDAVVNHIVHIEQETVTSIRGGYSDFERVRAERLAQQQAAYKRQQREIAHIESYINRFRAQATKARQAQSRIKSLERMQRIAPAHVDSPFHFSFREPLKLPHPLLQLRAVAAGYGEIRILHKVGLTLEPGQRIGLLGANGAGKSTLIKLLAGEIEPQAGERHVADDLRIGYFAQHQLEQLRADRSPLQQLQPLAPRAREQELRDYLGGYGFRGARVDEACGNFSGGEKARLVLALLIHQQPNLLLLDEPTNHLDLEMRHALAMALQEFEGAMVIVAHDRHLLRMTCDTLLLVDAGAVSEFGEDLDGYARWLVARNRVREEFSETGLVADQADQTDNSAAAKRERKRLEAEQRAQLQPLKKKLAEAERRMERFAARQAELERQLADADLYLPQHKERLTELLRAKAEVDAGLAQAESDWLDLGEALEALGEA